MRCTCSTISDSTEPTLKGGKGDDLESMGLYDDSAVDSSGTPMI